ncbi:leukotriene C4 synthase isoform X2 [Pan troglodytes]|uniref:leukotriene C4 synthase isoform X2 n=1 Tax=Pan troglodytes TaxID=9598 RepID=UPI0005124F56|nr:leukotriene C4 synthase isoform X2 [Pan troglodytes]
MVTPPCTPSTEMGRGEHRGCSSSPGPTSEQQTGLSVPQLAFTHSPCHHADGTMKDEVALLAAVTLLGVLLQAYFSLQVISARRAFRVSPPLTTGPPEFERVYRAQGGGPVRPGLPVRAPPLLPGLRALRAAQAGTPVRERARPLAAGGAGCARPARPLPPGRAARRAPRTAPDAAAVGLRPRPPGRRSRERRAGASSCPGEGRSLPHPSLYH